MEKDPPLSDAIDRAVEGTHDAQADFEEATRTREPPPIKKADVVVHRADDLNELVTEDAEADRT
jgi:hypothetical protein